MKALIYDDGLKFLDNYKEPVLKAGEALIETTMAGICNTDEEITKGYMGYKGVLGHEFTGIVKDVFNGADKYWIGKRVVGEINAGCSKSSKKNCANPLSLSTTFLRSSSNSEKWVICRKLCL